MKGTARTVMRAAARREAVNSARTMMLRHSWWPVSPVSLPPPPTPSPPTLTSLFAMPAIGKNPLPRRTSG